MIMWNDGFWATLSGLNIIQRVLFRHSHILFEVIRSLSSAMLYALKARLQRFKGQRLSQHHNIFSLTLTIDSSLCLQAINICYFGSQWCFSLLNTSFKCSLTCNILKNASKGFFFFTAKFFFKERLPSVWLNRIISEAWQANKMCCS